MRYMFIAKNYQNEVNKLPDLTDHEFMARQIWQLRHVYTNELTSIKNTRHEFVAFTQKFAEEFGANDESLGKTAETLAGMSKEDYAEIHEQEEIICNTLEFQDSIYLLRKNKDIINYVLRKHPLVNPTTNNCVGILINTTRVMPGIFRKLMLNKFLPFNKALPTIKSNELSEHQRQIAFCLLLGFHSRKEIAALLSNMTNTEYSETRIKNSLQALYNKFDCNTPGQLLNLISMGQINIELPAEILSTGNFPLEQLTVDGKKIHK